MSNDEKHTDFVKELESLINRHSQENKSDTPDFILAEYLQACLNAWNHGVYVRERWYGRECGNGTSLSRNKPGGPEPSREKEKS